MAAKKKGAAKADDEKKESPVGRKGPRGMNLEKSKIKLLVKDNPKREGSKSHARFEEYRNGMTVQEAIDAGITTGDLKYDQEHEFIEIKVVPA